MRVDQRGTGRSPGRFRMFAPEEATDYYDAIEWAARQPWSTGKVATIKDFGAFIEVAPGQDGLCHISELDEGFVKNVQDIVKVGDEVEVKVINIDDQGRVKLSRRAVLAEQAEENAEEGETVAAE